jgi:hypothetical protein
VERQRRLLRLAQQRQRDAESRHWPFRCRQSTGAVHLGLAVRGQQLHQLLADQHAGAVAVHRVLDAAAARVDQRVGVGGLEDVLVLARDHVVEVDQQLRRAVGLGVVAEQPLAQLDAGRRRWA